MEAITQSLGEESEAALPQAYSWDDDCSIMMMETFRKQLEAGFAILDVRNPNQINGLQQVLRFIDTSLS